MLGPKALMWKETDTVQSLYFSLTLRKQPAPGESPSTSNEEETGFGPCYGYADLTLVSFIYSTFPPQVPASEPGHQEGQQCPWGLALSLGISEPVGTFSSTSPSENQQKEMSS